MPLLLFYCPGTDCCNNGEGLSRMQLHTGNLKLGSAKKERGHPAPRSRDGSATLSPGNADAWLPFYPP